MVIHLKGSLLLFCYSVNFNTGKDKMYIQTLFEIFKLITIKKEMKERKGKILNQIQNPFVIRLNNFYNHSTSFTP